MSVLSPHTSPAEPRRERPRRTEFAPERSLDGPSLVRDGEILARGVEIGELVGSLSFVDMLFFQLQARLPSEIERRMMEAYLVSLCEHGVTSPSTHGPRVTASVRAPFAASAISFIASAMGPYHFGALERSMEELLELDTSDESVDTYVDRKHAAGQRIWGFGHRFHKSAGGLDPAMPLQEDADPRVRCLIALADDLGWNGRHLRRVREIGRLLHARKRIPINIDGVAAGLLLDMGFSSQTALLFVVLGRLPNIARLHAEECAETPNRFTALATREDPGFDRTIDRDQHNGSDR
ncbi:MAG: citrate/2-methylcitrate synthase [Phycisphaerales bacterium]|jgi:citrate synthase|nr:citrate/2-methylcitrate synthase [Phycisphaerales bacterium]